MRLRFHSEKELLSKITDCECGVCKIKRNRTTKGLIVLESSPQIRTIFTSGNKGLVRLPFPYVMYVVGYRREKEKYIYSGVEDAGLRVFFRNSPMEKYTDSVFCSPMDADNYGLVCTPHDHDFKVFDDLPSLVNHVITLWWNISHTIYDINFNFNEWKELSIEECLNQNWGVTWVGEQSFPNALKKAEAAGFGCGHGYCPDPINSELVNESWPPVSIVKSIENLQKLTNV